ncbi:MAG TPA: acetyl-CoA C-acyltransferase FadI [Thermodesulfobacteriota bacterium]
MKNLVKNGRRVAIVYGLRTPFIKSGTLFKNLSSLDLGKIAAVELINRTEIDPQEVDEVIFGTVIPTVKTPNLARDIALGSGFSASTPAYTVTRACASASQAITNAAESIMSGSCDTVVAGGVESISDFPALFSKRFRTSLYDSHKGKNLIQKIKPFLALRFPDLTPDVPAIAELSTGLTMGESAEKMARTNHISREEQDALAFRSHKLAFEATVNGRLGQEIIHTLIPPDFSTSITSDNGIRKETSLESLSELAPVFDEKYGTITAGNSSHLSDGASALLLMNEERAKALGYKPLGYIRSYAYAALSPEDQLLMGPAYSTPIALDRAGLAMRDIDLIEIHEAFAAQVLSNIQALASKRFAEEKLGRSEPIGEIDMEKFNVMGGSIAIGHPFGATGGRVTITLLNELRRRGGNFGLVSVCAAGAIGISMVLERE